MSHTDITCKQAYDMVMAYLDNELSRSDRETFETHLYKCCPSCEAYLASYKETVRLTRQAGQLASSREVPPQLIQSILAAAPIMPRRPEIRS